MNGSLILVMAVMALALTGTVQAEKDAPLSVAPNVDLEAYTSHPWYEIAAIPQWFEKGCVKVRAEYDLLTTGELKIRNYCTKEDGKETSSVGHGTIPNAAQPAKLRVSFFWPLSSDYWILFVDSEYHYAIVGDPSRTNLWILSQFERVEAETLRRLLVVAEAKGYDISQVRTLPDTVVYPDDAVDTSTDYDVDDSGYVTNDE